MKERPILFTGPSIPMVMAGIKTQTRRIADLERLSVDLPAGVRSDLWDTMPASERRVATKGRYRAGLNPLGAVFAMLKDGEVFGLKPGEFHFRCPLVDGTTSLMDLGNGKKIWTVTPVGEQRLWVKETHAMRTGSRLRDDVLYRADIKSEGSDAFKGSAYSGWLSSRFMPRWASRTNLIPIQARLMRLQDITEEDAQLEGVTFTMYEPGGPGFPGWHYGPSKTQHECLYTPRMAFANYWNRLHSGDGAWDRNPWVWAYTFRKEA